MTYLLAGLLGAHDLQQGHDVGGREEVSTQDAVQSGSFGPNLGDGSTSDIAFSLLGVIVSMPASCTTANTDQSTLCLTCWRSGYR